MKCYIIYKRNSALRPDNIWKFLDNPGTHRCWEGSLQEATSLVENSNNIKFTYKILTEETDKDFPSRNYFVMANHPTQTTWLGLTTDGTATWKGTHEEAKEKLSRGIYYKILKEVGET